MEEQRQGRWRKVKIYLDSYIAACFWLHLLCVCLVGTVLRIPHNGQKYRRPLLASLCCTGMDVLALVLFSGSSNGRNGLMVTLITVTEFILGAWIAYGRKKSLSGGILLFVITALFSGLFQLLPVRNTGLFCLTGALVFPCITAGIRLLFRTKRTQNWLFEAHLIREGEEKVLSAFLDTGNRLRLYGSGVPVVVVDGMYLAEWMKKAESTTPQKLVFLPYRGVGGKGLLYGVRLECMLNLGDGRKIFREVAAVAAEHNLFRGCSYQMILQPEVFSTECEMDIRKGETHVV